MSTKTKEEVAAAQEGKEIEVKQEAGALMLAEFEAGGGDGFEEADSSSYAIPFLKVLQSMSKQCKRANPEYVEGAVEGEFFNTVTSEVFAGNIGLLFVPVHFRSKFLEWAGTLDEGGGLIAQHDLATGSALLAKCTRDKDGNDRLPVGEDGMAHIIQDVREHFGIAIHPETGAFMPLVLSCASTQIKKSKKWMSQMGALKRNPLQARPDAMYSHVYRLTTVPEKKDSFDFFGLKIDHVSGLEHPIDGIADNNLLYAAAKEFREMIISGKAQTVAPDEEIPF